MNVWFLAVILGMADGYRTITTCLITNISSQRKNSPDLSKKKLGPYLSRFRRYCTFCKARLASLEVGIISRKPI